MQVVDPDMLITFDGNLAYIGKNKRGRFYVEHGGANGGMHAGGHGGLLSEHDTLADALLAAAREVGAIS